MPNDPLLPNLLAGSNTEEFGKYKEIQDKKSEYLNDKEVLLSKIEELLGISVEMDQLILAILNVTSGGDQIIKLMSEYFLLTQESNSEQSHKIIISQSKKNEELEEKLSEKKKQLEKSTHGLKKGGQFAPWKKHEKVILNVIAEYESDENRVKFRSDASKITQKIAMNMIEKEVGQLVTESTFNTWLRKFRKNNRKVFS